MIVSCDKYYEKSTRYFQQGTSFPLVFPLEHLCEDVRHEGKNQEQRPNTNQEQRPFCSL